MTLRATLINTEGRKVLLVNPAWPHRIPPRAILRDNRVFWWDCQNWEPDTASDDATATYSELSHTRLLDCTGLQVERPQAEAPHATEPELEEEPA